MKCSLLLKMFFFFEKKNAVTGWTKLIISSLVTANGTNNFLQYLIA